ncbi:hypothetical protein TNCV_2655631 [Trichonephila clavipes]|nr:hypothetical protein TNCV_2655631 [Trichonephila clavipes]
MIRYFDHWATAAPVRGNGVLIKKHVGAYPLGRSVEVSRGSSGAVLVTLPRFKMTRSIASGRRVALESDLPPSLLNFTERKRRSKYERHS